MKIKFPFKLPISLPKSAIAKKVGKFVTQHKTGICEVLGFVGLGSTAYWAWEGGRKSVEIDESLPEEPTVMDKIKAYGPIAAPTIISAIGTGVAFRGAIKSEAAKVAVMASLAAASESALEKYREQMIQAFGETKAKEVMDSVSQKRIEDNPLHSETDIIATGYGTTLFYDSMSGRYFYSDRNAVAAAVVDFNRSLIAGDMWATVNEFYDRLGLPEITVGDLVAYNVDHMLEIYFSTQWAKEGSIPCGVLEYTKLPVPYKGRYD